MKIYIIIPAYNEAGFIGETLLSLINQTLKPNRIVVVDDGSTDNTPNIVAEFASKYSEVSLIKKDPESEKHLPGSKVINAFNEGLKSLDEDYELICKFDADLIFPKNYLEVITKHFQEDPKIGLAGGFCVIEKQGEWVLENLTGKDHIRGALKTYRKACFKDFDGLKPAMGWDTLDELLAQYYGWKLKTDKNLLVKHLKATGKNYSKSSKYKQGEAFYRLRYGLIISLLASAKLALKKGKLSFFSNYMQGFFKAKKEKRPFLVSEKEGRFIRKLRWEKMRSKLF
ncbi:MAG TPA: glycosyltransferase [Salegentibacter sp.]|uniref:glycosyltransferase n=1 Tax=Salegentibacter sp. TaxID=1903072 RepID=UPI002F92B271